MTQSDGAVLNEVRPHDRVPALAQPPGPAVFGRGLPRVFLPEEAPLAHVDVIKLAAVVVRSLRVQKSKGGR